MKLKHKIIYISIISVFIISSIFLPCFAFASSNETFDDDASVLLPYPYTNAICVYNIPSISFVYYRTDTGVRANSLPVALTFAVIQEDEDADGYFDKFTPHIIVGGSDYADGLFVDNLILDINPHDFPNPMTQDYYVCISDRVPAYYSATNSTDFIPRYHTGEFLYSYTLPNINYTNYLTFNAFSIKNELVSVDMADFSTPETDGQVSSSIGYIKGLTTIQLYNANDRLANPTNYNKWEFKFFSGIVPSFFDYNEKVYYLDDLQNSLEDTYNAWYDAGYTDGYDEGEFSGYYAGHHDGREAGYIEGFDEGYNTGVELGKTGLGRPMEIFRSIFRWLGSLFEIELIPGISVGLLILIPVFFALVLFIIHMVRG